MLPDRSQTAAPQGSAALVLGEGKRKTDYGLELNRHTEYPQIADEYKRCADTVRRRGID